MERPFSGKQYAVSGVINCSLNERRKSMKKIPVLIVLLGLMLLLGTNVATAAVTGSTPPKFEFPCLLSNAGQGPDGKNARAMINFQAASKAVMIYETNYWYSAEPLPSEIAKYKTIIFAISSSAKGLGASGITIDEEVARLNKVVAEAKKLKIKIVALLMNGKDNRGLAGSANEQSIDAIAPFADYFIVRKDGDTDGKFKKIADKNKVPLTYFETGILDLPGLFAAMFSK